MHNDKIAVALIPRPPQPQAPPSSPPFPAAPSHPPSVTPLQLLPLLVVLVVVGRCFSIEAEPPVLLDCRCSRYRRFSC